MANAANHAHCRMRSLSTHIGRLWGGSGAAGAVARVITFRALMLAANLGTGLLTAALLGAAGRGELAALIVAPQFVTGIALFGLPASYMYHAKADNANERNYLGCALLLAIPATLAATALGCAAVPLWLGRHGADLTRMAQLLLLTVPFSTIGYLLASVLEAHGRFGFVAGTMCLPPLSTLVLLLLLAAFGRVSPEVAAAAYALPILPTFALLAVNAWRLVRPRMTFASRFLRRILGYGLRQYGFDVLGAIGGYLDQIVVVFLLAPTAVGVYAVALSLSRMLSVLQGAVWTVLFPSVAGRSAADVVETVAATMRVTTVALLAAVLCLGMLGPYLLELLYGREFVAGATAFRILLAETVVSNAVRILYQAFSATGRPGVVAFFEGTGLLATLAAMLLLVPRYGIDGAAGAVLIGAATRLICVAAGFRTVLQIRTPRLVLNRSDIAWVLARR